MAEAAAEEGRAAHLPEQPRQGLGAFRAGCGQELAELLGEIDEDCAGFEDPDRLGTAAIEQRRDFGIGIHVDEAAAELVALADVDQPGVIFGILVTALEQFLEHDRDLLPVRRPSE